MDLVARHSSMARAIECVCERACAGGRSSGFTGKVIRLLRLTFKHQEDYDSVLNSPQIATSCRLFLGYPIGAVLCYKNQ